MNDSRSEKGKIPELGQKRVFYYINLLMNIKYINIYITYSYNIYLE